MYVFPKGWKRKKLLPFFRTGVHCRFDSERQVSGVNFPTTALINYVHGIRDQQREYEIKQVTGFSNVEVLSEDLIKKVRGSASLCERTAIVFSLP